VRTFGHWLQYLALRAYLAIAALIPRRALSRMLEQFGAAVLILDRRHRAIILDNLQIAFPEWSQRQRDAVARAAFANWGRIAAELAHAESMLAAPASPELLNLRARVDELSAAGRGVLILSAHTANFELLARMAGEPGRELFVFHRSMSNELVNRHLIDARRRAHLGTLGRGPTVREALRVLGRGGVIVLPMDQNQPRRKGIFVEMFGRQACTSTVLARLSLATGAPVLPVFAVWDGDRLSARMSDAIWPPSQAADRKATVAALTERYTREIESAVRAHPAQWNWAHRRWKTRPLSELPAVE